MPPLTSSYSEISPLGSSHEFPCLAIDQAARSSGFIALLSVELCQQHGMRKFLNQHKELDGNSMRERQTSAQLEDHHVDTVIVPRFRLLNKLFINISFLGFGSSLGPSHLFSRAPATCGSAA